MKMDFIRNKLNAIAVYCTYAVKFWHPGKKTVCLIGTPVYDNMGDCAICLAEKQFLKNSGFDYVVEITTEEAWNHGKVIAKMLPRTCWVCFQGGGNMGDQYHLEEELRKKLFREFAGHRMLVFPQTIHYSNTENGRNMRDESREWYQKTDNLILSARESRSFQEMRTLYPNRKVVAVPDIVLSGNMQMFGVVSQKKAGILLCMRRDSERIILPEQEQAILNALQKTGIPVQACDMYIHTQITKENRQEAVRGKMQEFANACLVVTDRLHGMIFAALTGTPCIVLSNNNYKIRGTYEQIRYLPYIRFAESAEDAEDLIPQMLNIKQCVFDNRPLQSAYDQLRQVLLE